MFPMKDASTSESFYFHSQAMGASHISAAAHFNMFLDSLCHRFKLTPHNITLAGCQHGSCLALSAAMVRKRNPVKRVLLLEPYILEACYLKKELPHSQSTIYCIENRTIRYKSQQVAGNRQ